MKDHEREKALISEKAVLEHRKLELERKYVELNRVDRLALDKEYRECQERIEQIDKELTVEDQTEEMDREIKVFRKRLKDEVEEMLKK